MIACANGVFSLLPPWTSGRDSSTSLLVTADQCPSCYNIFPTTFPGQALLGCTGGGSVYLLLKVLTSVVDTSVCNSPSAVAFPLDSSYVLVSCGGTSLIRADSSSVQTILSGGVECNSPNHFLFQADGSIIWVACENSPLLQINIQYALDNPTTLTGVTYTVMSETTLCAAAIFLTYIPTVVHY